MLNVKGKARVFLQLINLGKYVEIQKTNFNIYSIILQRLAEDMEWILWLLVVAMLVW